MLSCITIFIIYVVIASSQSCKLYGDDPVTGGRSYYFLIGSEESVLFFRIYPRMRDTLLPIILIDYSLFSNVNKYMYLYKI